MLPIDDCRAAFVQAFKAYAQAGNAMRDLLIARETGPHGPQFPMAVAAQQQRLNEARERYNCTRTAYVQAILQTMNLPTDSASQSAPEAAFMDIRPRHSGPH